MLSGTRATSTARPSPAKRERVGLALGRRSAFERLVLTLLLVERMTASEVGAVLGLPAADVTRAADRLLAGLRVTEPRRVRASSQRRRAA